MGSTKQFFGRDFEPGEPWLLDKIHSMRTPYLSVVRLARSGSLSEVVRILK